MSKFDHVLEMTEMLNGDELENLVKILRSRTVAEIMDFSIDPWTLTIEPDDPVGETAQKLITELCAEMSARYGVPPSPFSLSETAAPRTIFLVTRLRGAPIGCGALRQFDEDTAEIKRMYVAPMARLRGVARQILATLERHAQRFGYQTIRLETGIRQPEARRLYESMGFRRIEAFGSYIGNPSSVCFEKAVLH